jgi:signal transduction histidine kinase
MHKTIKLKLLEEFKARSVRLLAPHLLVLVVSFIFLSKMHRALPFSTLPYLMVCLALFMRFYIIKSFYGAIKLNNFFAVSAYLFFAALTGLGWGVLLWNTYHFYGLFSAEMFYGMGVLLTLMSGAVTAFSSSLPVSYIFLVSISYLPIDILFRDPHESSYLLGLLLLGNLIYQFYHSYISYSYQRNSLRDEITALNQKKSLQEFIDACPGLILALDSDETYVMVNNYNQGFFKEKFLNKKIGEVYPGSGFPETLKEFIDSSEMEAVKEIKSDVYGGENWWMVNLRKVSLNDFNLIVAALPITEMVKARNDLKIQEARSQYAAKLASLGELSAGIAHEVNNPLTIIEGAANLMKIILTEKPLDVKALENSAGKVMETTQRIARIIKSLRMLAGDAEVEPFKNTTFEAIVEPSIEISKAKLQEHNIKLSVDSGNSDVALFGNEIQLSQVMMNLVSNAIDAVKELSGPRWIEIHYVTSIEWLDILVVDSGEGVALEIRKNIMDPFFTTKDSHQGTGLGLSISHSIMNAHNGNLCLIEDRKNTTFRLRFPRMNPFHGPKRSGQKEDTGAAL